MQLKFDQSEGLIAFGKYNNTQPSIGMIRQLLIWQPPAETIVYMPDKNHGAMHSMRLIAI